MQLTSFILGFFVVVALTGVRICGLMVSVTNVGERADMTVQAVNAQINNNFLAWFLQILGQRPAMSTHFPDPDPNKADDCPHCQCGLTNTQRRIVGGVETKKNEYPWMAQMIMQERFYCGATVINSRYVLTAAHCVDDFNKERIVVRIGDYDRWSVSETTVQDFKVVQFIKHGGYSTSNYDNDIAIVELKGVINFEGSMRPVCLAERGPTYAGRKGIVIGWGAISESGSTSNILREVRVPIMTNAECRSTKYSASQITENMLCAGYADGDKDSCQGDSGGPLHVVNDDDEVHRLVGIVSWGDGCARPMYPGVYTRVNRYLSWIERNTANACYCN